MMCWLTSILQWFPINFLNDYELIYLNIFVKLQSFSVVIFISAQIVPLQAQGSLFKLHKPNLDM